MKKIMEEMQLIKKQFDKYGIKIPSGCSDAMITDFLSDFEQEFNYTIDLGYIEFIRTLNGLEFNGFIIYPCVKNEENESVSGEDIIESNLTWIDGDESFMEKTVFAESDIDLYIKDLKTLDYQIVSKYSDEVFERFDSFEDLIVYGIKKYFE